MHRMGLVPSGDCFQFIPKPEQSRDPFQGQRLVAVLRAFLTNHDRETARDVGGTHGALGLVLVLASRPSGAKGFKADIPDRQRFRCIR